MTSGCHYDYTSLHVLYQFELKYSVIVSPSPDLLRVRHDIFIRGYPSLSRLFPDVVTVEPTHTAHWISKIVDSEVWYLAK